MTNYDIEKAIETLFCETASDFVFKKVDIQKGLARLTQPGMNIAVISGNYTQPEISNNLEETIQIVVLMVFRNVASEEFRRQSAHSAVQYVVSKLQGQTLGLDINPIQATGWSERTSHDDLAQALLVVEANFTTALQMTPKMEEHEFRILKSVWSSYNMGEDIIVESVVDFTGEQKNGD